ncbi:restriction endonuclease subunit S [Psychrobacter sp. LFX-11D]|uniref:restriction endonuclease subunit S n=1 Tax=Psychrobacter sp. LFX-11D TaxID=458201 RepID=UPI001918A200|nr:restriction endonuclease subunit S [Psychrobacter sp. LFX-11D]
MTKYQQYDEYKDSGVEWLGEIPIEWNLLRGKWRFKSLKEVNRNLQCMERLALTMRGVIERSIESDDGLQPLKFSGYQIFEKNDLVFKLIDLENYKTSRVGLVFKKGIMSPAYIRLQPFSSVYPKFYYYLYFDLYLRGIYNEIGGQGVRSALNASDLLELEVCVPNITEQVQIANFLDYEIGQIDTLIEKKQTLIKLLKEKRQAVISHGVTKGLNPNALMKDSGVEWLGEVPEHWAVGRVGYYGQVLNGSTPSKANLSYWHPKEVAWLSSGEVNQYYIESPTDYISYKALKECSVTLLPVGTLVMGMIGQGKTRGTSAVTKIEATINQNLAAVIPNENLYSNYAHLFFQAAYKELREDARGGNQAALNCEIIRDFKITIPPIDEQRIIFIEINKISEKFDILIVKAEKAIQLMQERRTALISAAVTGKIDVRGWVESE